jgi:hypothetical protein
VARSIPVAGELVELRRRRNAPALEPCAAPPGARRAWLVREGDSGRVAGLVELRQSERPGRVTVVSEWVPWAVGRIGPLPACQTRAAAAVSVLYVPPVHQPWAPPFDPVCEHIADGRAVGGDVTGLYLALSHIVRHIDELAAERKANPAAFWRELATMKQWAELALTATRGVHGSALEAAARS